MKKTDLAALFNKFAGQEIPMQRFEFCLEGQDYAGLKPVNNPDPVIDTMNQVAQENGLELMVWNPAMKEADFKAFKKANTVNAYLEQGADGKYRVSNKFTLG